MDDKKRFAKLLFTARETALWGLNELGVLLPMGLSMSTDDDDVKVYFPRDDHPEADWPALVNAADDNLRHQIRRNGVRGVALVTPLENDGATGIGIQVEMAQAVVMLIYPYERRGETFVLDEPMEPDNLLADRFFE